MSDSSVHHIAIAGPLPPPFGGMANQTKQLAELLSSCGYEVVTIRTNAPYIPSWIGKIRGLRAFFRLIPFLVRTWSTLGRVQLVHLMANSGWSWHLFAAPVIWLAKIRRVPVIVNYRGGEAETFFERQISWIKPSIRQIDSLVVPSGFLQAVFSSFGIETEVIPNIIDLDRFCGNRSNHTVGDNPHIVVCRNLEEIYDVETAIRAFQRINKELPRSRLTIAGEGPERQRLVTLVNSMGLNHAVEFTGRLDRDRMVMLFESADLMLNSSRVDNMPNALLESMASGVPIVTTDAGGIPYMVSDRTTARMCSIGDDESMAKASIHLLSDSEYYQKISINARRAVNCYRWESVKSLWETMYVRVVNQNRK